ncbi:magnesium chelatase subunit D family protein [Pedobacter sp. AW31-3R]|uniref:magnesium chelatase subunit D family protein n=1 Tax=Pedobacter sp. AW31-3R TaxID=3445781 RepID=UPI003FA0E3FB
MNYPFTAIVGQEKLKKALVLCAINPAIGGLLIQGDKGTAKSTAARSLAEIIPPMSRIAKCRFNCTEDKPLTICEVCNRPDRTLEQVKVPFVNLPLGATEERILGSLDLGAVLVEKKKKFQPGLLASVHRGILYIDEVNLLPDHLVDVLLDVSAMAENRIEREGLSLSHPSRFTLIGTMNPEEGQLRPQFLDRFGLMVHVEAPADVTERTEVVRRRIAFETDPEVFRSRWELSQQNLQHQLLKAKQLLPKVRLDDDLLSLISELTTVMEVRSLRADIVVYKTAITLAALHHRTAVNREDILEAAELALSHRSRKKTGYPTPPLKNNTRKDHRENGEPDQNKSGTTAGQPEPKIKNPEPSAERNEQESKGRSGQKEAPGYTGEGKATENESDQGRQSGTEPECGDENYCGSAEDNGTEGEEKGAAEQVFNAGLSTAALPKIQALDVPVIDSPQEGRRNVIPNVKRGSYQRAELVGNTSDIAIEATVVHALLRNPDQFDISAEDLHHKIRSGKTSNLILFVVDASGSMAASKRMEAVKGTVFQLLTEAYEKRDTVGVIAFRGIAAQILLDPTQSIDLAREAMRNLPTGGRTPLPHALQTAIGLLSEYDGKKGYHPIMVILTDGKANVPVAGTGDDPWSQTLTFAAQLKAMNVQSLVLNSGSGYLQLDKAEALATALGGQYQSLEDISAEQLTPIVNRLS